jgi:hypothetical protein
MTAAKKKAPPNKLRLLFTPHGYAAVFEVSDDGEVFALQHDRADTLAMVGNYELVKPKEPSR